MCPDENGEPTDQEIEDHAIECMIEAQEEAAIEQQIEDAAIEQQIADDEEYDDPDDINVDEKMH